MKTALAVLCLAAAVSWAAWTAGGNRKSAVLALSGPDAAALSPRAGEILERAKIIGVSAVILREETVAQAVERGEMLQFSRSELEKWRAMGLLSPGAPVKAGSLWVKDAGMLSRLASAASRRGVEMTTAAAGGYHSADFPPGFDPSALGLGLEPGLLASIDQAGLRAQARPAAAREVDGGAGCGAVLRAAFESPEPFLVWRFSPALDAEGNFDALRQCAARLKALGVSLDAPFPPAPAHPALCWLLLALGPLLSARLGLLTLRRARFFALDQLPQASPVLETGAAVLAVGIAATLIGLAMKALGGLALHDSAAAWRAYAALAAPLALGGAALYSAEFPGWGRRFKEPLTAGGLLRAAAVLALLVLLKPGHRLTPWMERVTSLFEPLWWWPWRWRELLVGYPCLVIAYDRLLSLWSCPDCEGEGEEKKIEPRPWTLAALLAPAGMIAALGDSGLPSGLGLGQAWQTLLMGSAAGAFLVLGRHWLAQKKPRS